MPVAAPAGGLKDLPDGWLISRSHVADLLVPDRAWEHGRQPTGGVSATAGQASLFGMTELPQYYLEAGYCSRRFEVVASWQRTGADLYREERLSILGAVGQGWRLLLSASAELQRIAGSASQTGLVAGLGLASPPFRSWSVAIQWPLTSPPAWQGERALRRWLVIAGSLASRAHGALAVDRDGRGNPVLQTDLMIQVAPRCGLGWRSEPATGSFGLTTAWAWPTLMLRSAHTVHPELGPTHRWSLTLGCLGSLR
jgi:hypothetical protein